MALIRWQPFREIETLRRQFDELFEELARGNRESEMTWTPLVELQDMDDNLILRAQLPGLEAKDLDVQVTRDAVSISGEHRSENKVEEKGYFRSEFRYGKFQRMIPLPVHIQNERVQADFQNGVLTLTLPKVEEAQRRVVRLNLGESQGVGSVSVAMRDSAIAMPKEIAGANASTNASTTVEANSEQGNGHNDQAQAESAIAS
ncbi:Hsp20/alpha crystallin family protein [Coleofasciculus sp. FACHB-SPT9]|uniref:Hsp20/alpha crystallin family protein n=1 Tax=Cyanophyceae TaxID=3028117 RepID=UPI0016830BF6|nr:Hsp20/alpha crystallin family protein [Coleofasciculus sp. FACHB-SPT9]MBD1892550.1 Hsp20/alpha crystallin family protein [Coleofasciculus sp. FACHB-SPT9]